MDVCLGRPLYIVFANFGKVEVYLPKHQKVGEVAYVPIKMVHVKEEGFL